MDGCKSFFQMTATHLFFEQLDLIGQILVLPLLTTQGFSKRITFTYKIGFQYLHWKQSFAYSLLLLDDFAQVVNI